MCNTHLYMYILTHTQTTMYCLLVCLSSITIFIPAVRHTHTHTHTHTRTHARTHARTCSTFTIRHCLFTVHVAVIDCPSPTAGAGDVVAAALPNLKCLRKVTVSDMRPVPVLQTVGLCGKLQEVSVWSPEYYEVGMRCAYRCM